MAYPEEVVRALRSAYISGLALKAAAESTGVPYATARIWKRKNKQIGDDWDHARAAARISTGGVTTLTAEVLEDFVHLFKSTLEELKTNTSVPALSKADAISRLSDAYAKTVKAAGASNPELSRLAISMDVLKGLAEYIARHRPELLEAFMAVLEPFGEELSQQYG